MYTLGFHEGALDPEDIREELKNTLVTALLERTETLRLIRDNRNL